jgi:hypothetical protein
MTNDLNKFISIVKVNGMKYFECNIKELKQWINKLECLRTSGTQSVYKTIYYMLLELLELIENKDNDNIDYDIKYLENRFLEYINVTLYKVKYI